MEIFVNAWVVLINLNTTVLLGDNRAWIVDEPLYK